MVRATKEALGWDPDKDFYVPDEVYAHMNRVDRGNELETEWEQVFARWAEAFPQDREKWDAAWDGRIGPWELPEWKPGEDLATRDAGKVVMQAFKDAVPTMIGGAADLVPQLGVGQRAFFGDDGRVVGQRARDVVQHRGSGLQDGFPRVAALPAGSRHDAPLGLIARFLIAQFRCVHRRPVTKASAW